MRKALFLAACALVLGSLMAAPARAEAKPAFDPANVPATAQFRPASVSPSEFQIVYEWGSRPDGYVNPQAALSVSPSSGVRPLQSTLSSSSSRPGACTETIINRFVVLEVATNSGWETDWTTQTNIGFVFPRAGAYHVGVEVGDVCFDDDDEPFYEIHDFTEQTVNVSDDPCGRPYWYGWDIAQGIALTAKGAPCDQGWIVDGWGGTHSFGAAPNVVGPYWKGWNIARGLSMTTTAKGYLVDGWGGTHAIGSQPPPVAGPYWRGWDIARDIALEAEGKAGVIVDGWGGLHRVGNDWAEIGTIQVAGGPYWRGWDIARGVALLPDGSGGWVLDGWGGLHPFGSAQAKSVTGGPYWKGWDIARGVSVYPDGSGGVIVDGWGGHHKFVIS